MTEMTRKGDVLARYGGEEVSGVVHPADDRTTGLRRSARGSARRSRI